MNNRNLFIICILLLLTVVAEGGCRSQVLGSSDDSELEASGLIEARQVGIASEIGGRVVEVLVEEGQSVTAGQSLVRLDDSSLAAQVTQAEANLRMAEAKLALLKAGPPLEQVRAAEAQLAQAEANLHMAEANLNALTTGAPLETIETIRERLERARARYHDMQVVLNTGQIEKAVSVLKTAEANLALARVRHEGLAKESQHPAYTIAAAETAVADAQAAVDATREAYEAIMDESQPYYAKINLMHRCWEVAQANLDQARARRDSLADDERTTPDALDAAEATLHDAQHLVDVIEAAYNALTSGTSAPPLDEAWAEVQQMQAQLNAAGSSLSGPSGVMLRKVPAVVTSRGLSVRSGPGAGYQRLGAVGRGTELVLRARNESGTWVLGRAPEEDLEGWFSASYMEIQGDIMTLPVARAGSLSPGVTTETASAAGTPRSVEALLAQIDAARAARDMAEARLSELQSGARPEEIDAAEASVEQARAALEALKTQQDKMTLRAPVDGLVISRSIQPGEIASPGATLLQLANLDQVKLTVFVPESKIARVQLGQTAQVTVDTFPDRVFEGKITFISQEAEFTPENTQTKEQRVNLVFAVKITLENPEHLLKPGMPADATLIVD